MKLCHLGRKFVEKVWPKTKIPLHDACDACVKGKIHAFAHKRRAPDDKRHFKPGQHLEVDYKGPMVPSLSGNTGRYLFVDRGSKNFITLWFVKSQTGWYDTLPRVIADTKSLTGNDLLVLKVDGSKVNTAGATTKMLLDNQTRREFQSPNDSNTLPLAEGFQRIVDEASMAMMAHANAPAYCWPEANNCFAHVYNQAFLVGRRPPTQRG